MRHESKSNKKLIRHLVQTSIGSEYKKDYILLFHCIRCGYHPWAVHQTWIKGNEKNIITRVIYFEKGKPKEIIKIGNINNADDESISTVMCGKCGIPGYIENMPKIYSDDDDLELAF